MASAEESVKDVIKPSQEDGAVMEPDEIPEEEDNDSDADYGKPHKSKGKRTRGRPKTKATEEARIAAALGARRKRMRLNHGTPDSSEKNPKRHLFGPLAESRDPGETDSPTPSKPANTNNDIKKVNKEKSSHSSPAGRMTRRKLAVQADSSPKKQSINTPPSLHDSVSPAVRPSLIVKLKIPRPSATTGVGMRRKRKATRSHAMTKEDDTREEEAVSQQKSQVLAREQRREMRSTNRMTEQRQAASPATKAHNDAPTSPQPKKPPTRRRPQKGVLASPVERPETRLYAPTSPAPENTNPSDPSGTPSDPLPPSPSPDTNTPAVVTKPPAPPQTASTSTPSFAPYPPMSLRAVSPFTRGARIALENLLADHRADPLVDLIDLVEELDDTRPIVNDWEHVTVMKGGSWIYQVMRDVWDEAAGGMDDDDDDDDDGEGEEEAIDIEGILEKVEGWVGREMNRLGGGGGGEQE